MTQQDNVVTIMLMTYSCLHTMHSMLNMTEWKNGHLKLKDEVAQELAEAAARNNNCKLVRWWLKPGSGYFAELEKNVEDESSTFEVRSGDNKVATFVQQEDGRSEWTFVGAISKYWKRKIEDACWSHPEWDNSNPLRVGDYVIFYLEREKLKF